MTLHLRPIERYVALSIVKLRFRKLCFWKVRSNEGPQNALRALVKSIDNVLSIDIAPHEDGRGLTRKRKKLKTLRSLSRRLLVFYHRT